MTIPDLVTGQQVTIDTSGRPAFKECVIAMAVFDDRHR